MDNILKYTEFNESKIWDNIKDKFRSKDNPNILAEEIFNKIKKDVSENLDVLISVEYDDGLLTMELSNKLKIKMILIKNELGKGESGLIILKPFRKKEETEIDVEYSRVERYINWILNKKEKNKEKANKIKVSKDIRTMIKK